MTTRKVLISGGSGYVGLALAERLLAKGHQVSAFHRNEKPADPGAVSWIRIGDLATTPIDPGIGSDVDVFVNLAAALHPTSTDADGLGSQTAGIARNMSQFIAEAGIRRVIVMSSIAARLAKKDREHARSYGIEKLAADRIFLEQSGTGRHPSPAGDLRARHAKRYGHAGRHGTQGTADPTRLRHRAAPLYIHPQSL